VEEKPGSFIELYSMIYPRSVTEVSYRFCGNAEAHIYIGFEVKQGMEERNQVVQQINARPAMLALDITDNDMAKSHLRYLAGGRAPAGSLRNERLYR
jgi:threonine dehydratase